MGRSLTLNKVVTGHIIWASGTCREDADPDNAMQKAWDNLQVKANDVTTNNQYHSKYITILFRNDIHDSVSRSWTVTLTASVEVA